MGLLMDKAFPVRAAAAWLAGWLLTGICWFGVGLLFNFIHFFPSLPRISNLRTEASVLQENREMP